MDSIQGSDGSVSFVLDKSEALVLTWWLRPLRLEVA
jgi:hypothetical protein